MLDFSKVHKKFLNVHLTDGSTLLIRMPTKAVFDSVLKLQEEMDIVNNPSTDSETAKDALDLTYELTAEIMSNNIGGKEISAEYLSHLFDVEDIRIFYNSYLDFVTGKISADPN